MSNSAYIGVPTQIDGNIKDVARLIKEAYLGVPTELPIYERKQATIPITESNINDLFLIKEDTDLYYGGMTTCFLWNDNTLRFILSEETNVDLDVTFIAKKDMVLNLSYSDSGKYLCLELNGYEVIEKTINDPIVLKKGDSLWLYYEGYDPTGYCEFANMFATAEFEIQVGSETKEIARRIMKAYIGDTNNVARLWLDPYDYLIDFDHTDGNNSSILTSWKGTYNGAISTELIIPDDSRIEL